MEPPDECESIAFRDDFAGKRERRVVEVSKQGQEAARHDTCV
jgi:hypothetical protein